MSSHCLPDTKPLVAAVLLLTTIHAQAAFDSYGASIQIANQVSTVALGGSHAFQASYVLSQYGSRGYAASSLTSGDLHSFSSGVAVPGCGGLFYCAGGRSEATMWDTVVIHNGVNASLIQPWLAIDGTLSGTGKAWVRWYVGAVNGDFFQKLDGYAPKQALATGETVFNSDAMLVPSYGDTTLFVYAKLITEAVGGPTWDSVADFGNTLHFNWTLPEGATYSSASGKFMTAPLPVPEPATWATLIAGLTALAGLARRRSRAAPGSVPAG